MNININFDDKIEEYVKEKNINVSIKKKIYDIVEFLLQHESINANYVDISIQIVDAEEIRKINKEYRGIDKKTDVLSFPIFEKCELDSIKFMTEDKRIKEIELGDILLCIDVIEAQAVEYETGILRELLYMVTHGTCHLLGYDHIKDDEKVKMRSLEELALEHIGVPKQYEVNL